MSYQSREEVENLAEWMIRWRAVQQSCLLAFVVLLAVAWWEQLEPRLVAVLVSILCAVFFIARNRRIYNRKQLEEINHEFVIRNKDR
jgi:hypothetical protein